MHKRVMTYSIITALDSITESETGREGGEGERNEKLSLFVLVRQFVSEVERQTLSHWLTGRVQLFLTTYFSLGQL